MEEFGELGVILITMSLAFIGAFLAVPDVGSANLFATLQQPGNVLLPPRVAVLNAHLEGNLGDEYETTPILELLGGWGATLDVYSAAWEAPENQMNPHAVRMLRGARAYYTSDEWFNTSAPNDVPLPGGEYDLLIYAPGPMIDRPVLDRMLSIARLSHACVAIVGVTMASSDWSYLLRADELSLAALVVTRDLDSFEAGASALGVPLPALDGASLSRPSATGTTAPQLVHNKLRLVLSGDPSFSYQPYQALLDRWSRFYRRQLVLSSLGEDEPWYVLFCRNEAHAVNNQRTNATHVVVGAYDGDGERTRLVAMPKERLLLATDSVVSAEGDVARQQALREQLGLAREPLTLESVEQMLGLFASSRQLQVVSDRYHPSMAAHRMGSPLHMIVNEEATGDDSMHAGDPSTP